MYDETSQIKETKIVLIHQYENFTMKNDENVKQMFERLNILINALEYQGQIYINCELVRKVLRTLPKSWERLVSKRLVYYFSGITYEFLNVI